MGHTAAIKVIAEGASACTATYRLEVTDRRTGNRSVTGGKAMIEPGSSLVISKVTVGPGSPQTIMAKLYVEPSNGSPYTQLWPM